MTQFSTARIAKTLSIAAATVMLAAPFTSQAANNYDAAMDTCIKAFVAANLPKEQPVTVRKEEAVQSPISIHARAYKINVSAKGVESGKYLARGTCIVDRNGAIIALNGSKLAPAQLASR